MSALNTWNMTFYSLLGCAMLILERLQPKVKVVGRRRVAANRPRNRKQPQLPKRKAPHKARKRDAFLLPAADAAGTCQGDFYRSAS